MLVHGAQPGPRVAATAGIHGAEYVSIAALREVALGAGPGEPARLARRRADREPGGVRGPDDLRQPDRRPQPQPAVPRRPGRLADPAPRALADDRASSPGSDVFVDMHCGDMNEALVSFTGIEDTGDAAVDARSRELAEAYGLRYLLIGPSPGTTTTAAAALGIPAVLGEVGGQGRWPAEDVALHAAGFRRVLRAAGLIDDAPAEPAHRTELLPDGGVDASDATTGYWHPAVAVGERVAQGAIVGEVQDAFGAVLERPSAPMDGVVIFLVSSLAMNAGDPAARPRRMTGSRAPSHPRRDRRNGSTAFADAEIRSSWATSRRPPRPCSAPSRSPPEPSASSGRPAGTPLPPTPARQYIVMLRGRVRSTVTTARRARSSRATSCCSRTRPARVTGRSSPEDADRLALVVVLD